MPRLGYELGQCRYCRCPMFLPFPTYRPRDVLLVRGEPCRDCLLDLALVFSGRRPSPGERDGAIHETAAGGDSSGPPR